VPIQMTTRSRREHPAQSPKELAPCRDAIRPFREDPLAARFPLPACCEETADRTAKARLHECTVGLTLARNRSVRCLPYMPTPTSSPLAACALESTRVNRLATLARLLAGAVALTSFQTFLFGQAAPAEKAADAAQAAKRAAEMAIPLTPADKKFIKDASEGLFFELAIVDIAQRRNRPVAQGRDAAYKLGARLHPDLQKAWEELSKIAQAKNEKMREELSGVEKRGVEDLRAVDIDKFNKEVSALLGKAGKELAQTFASPIQHPVLKQFAASHSPTFKQHLTEIAQAAK
jgi:hypothetical protein